MGTKGKLSSEIYKNYKEIRKLIEQHGKVRVVFAQVYRDLGDGYQLSEDQRRRIITKKGECRVSYKSNGYRRWSGYGASCFVENADSVKDFKKVLKLMRNHDGTWLKPIEVHYGLWFRKKVYL